MLELGKGQGYRRLGYETHGYEKVRRYVRRPYEMSGSQIVGMSLARNVFFLAFRSSTKRSAFLADIGGYVAVNEDYYVSAGIQACIPMRRADWSLCPYGAPFVAKLARRSKAPA